MTNPQSEPVRLLLDPNTASLLRGDLEQVSQSQVAFSPEAGLARFEEALSGVSTVPPGGSTGGLRVLGWFLGAVVLIGGGALIANELAASSVSEVSPPDVTVASTAAAETNRQHRAAHDFRGEGGSVAASPPSMPERVGPHSSPSPVAVAEVGDGDGAGGAGAGSSSAEGGSPALDAPTSPRPASNSNTSAPVPAIQPASQLDEAKQINAARKALAKDPAKTLEITAAAEAEFPQGAMVQERRGYAILALVALDRLDEANERADAYLQRWPKGPLSRRVNEALSR